MFVAGPARRCRRPPLRLLPHPAVLAAVLAALLLFGASLAAAATTVGTPLRRAGAVSALRRSSTQRHTSRARRAPITHSHVPQMPP